MRTLFLLLLLANLLFLGWATWVSPPVALAGRPTPSAPEKPAIHLLREAPAAQPERRPDAAAVVAPVADDLQGAACVSAGPYLERARAETAAGQLQRLGFTARLRASTDDIRVGQWVRVPNLATPEDAGNALAALKAAGLVDAYIVRDEAPGNTVSLGVFAEPARVAEAVALARKAGFITEVSDRTRSADVFWLDIDRRENGGLPGSDVLQSGRAEGSPPLDLRACPPAAPPAG